jgi:hypothetical protein
MANNNSIRSICTNLSSALASLDGNRARSSDLDITRLLFHPEYNLLFIEIPAKTVPTHIDLTSARTKTVMKHVVGLPVHVSTWGGSVYFRIKCTSEKQVTAPKKESSYAKT